MNDSASEKLNSVVSPLAGASGEAAPPATTVATGSAFTSGAKTDGAASYGNGDYSSETESDKPFILEIGTTSNINTTTTNTSSVPVVDFSNDYPLDMHLTTSNSFLSISAMRQQHLGSSDQPVTATLPHLSLYNNPYTHHLHLHQAQHQHLTSVTSLKSMQTVSVANPAGFLTQTWSAMDSRRQSTSELVPSAIYMSYEGMHEHFVSKEPNPVWKEKALQIEKDYKKTACDRERTRMRDMNRAFDLLRSKLPISKPNGKKYSKIESLRIAINYIHHLQKCLVEGSPEPEVSNLSTNSSKTIQFEQFGQTTVDYFAEMDGRRFRETNSEIHYESHKHSNYQLVLDKDSDEQLRSSWSENSYVPNGNDWE